MLFAGGLWLWIRGVHTALQSAMLGATLGTGLCLFTLSIVLLSLRRFRPDVTSPGWNAETTDGLIGKTDPRLPTYDLYRKRVVEEDRLINDRMIWMILSEPPIFGGWFLLIKDFQLKPDYFGLALVVLAVVGILIAGLCFWSVNAARDQIQTLQNEYLSRFKTDGPPPIPLIGTAANHRYGHVLPYCLPWIVIGLWVVVSYKYLL